MEEIYNEVWVTFAFSSINANLDPSFIKGIFKIAFPFLLKMQKKNKILELLPVFEKDMSLQLFSRIAGRIQNILVWG